MTLLLFIIIAFLIYYFIINKNGYRDIFNIKSVKRCPNCGSHVEESYNVCPICKETLKRKCSNCGERVDVFWNFCPYCEKTVNKGENQ